MSEAFISSETLTLLVESGIEGEKLAKILRAIDRDWNEATGKSHDQSVTFAANCLEGGVDPKWIAIAIQSFRELSGYTLAGLKPYARKVPSNWKKIRARVFQRDGQSCRYCGSSEGPFHIDHIIPLRKGGSHDDENLAVACQPCNLSKKDSTVEEWRARQ